MYDHILEYYFRKHQLAALLGQRERMQHYEGVLRLYWRLQDGAE